MNEQYEFDGKWNFEYQFDAFQGLQSRRGSYGTLDSKKESNGTTRVKIEDAPNEDYDPLPEQVSAINFLIQHGVEVKNALINKVYEEYPRLEKEMIEDVGREEYRDIIPEISGRDDCRNVFGISEIFIYPTHKDGFSYIGIEGGAQWEEEHGIGFIFHKDRVIAFGTADVALSSYEAKKDNGTYIEPPKRLNFFPKKIKPLLYQAHPKFGTMKPMQVESNKNYLNSLASQGFHQEFIQLVDVDTLKKDQEKTPHYLRFSIANSSDKVVEYILANIDTTVQGLIHHIQVRSNISTVDLLLKYGAEINELDSAGKTLLYKITSRRKSMEAYKDSGYIDFEEVISNMKKFEDEIKLRGGQL